MWKLRVINPITATPLYEDTGITLTKLYKKFKLQYPESDYITIEKMRNIHNGRNKASRNIISIEKLSNL